MKSVFIYNYLGVISCNTKDPQEDEFIYWIINGVKSEKVVVIGGGAYNRWKFS